MYSQCNQNEWIPFHLEGPAEETQLSLTQDGNGVFQPWRRSPSVARGSFHPGSLADGAVLPNDAI